MTASANQTVGRTQIVQRIAEDVVALDGLLPGLVNAWPAPAKAPVESAPYCGSVLNVDGEYGPRWDVPAAIISRVARWGSVLG